MDSSDDPDLAGAPTRFAEGDAAEGDDLKRRISACFGERFPSLKSIQVAVFGKTAALRGEVRSLQEKFECLECCRTIPGITRVVDDLIAVERDPFHFDPEEE
jgi:osmotically-inducible protein OsmY